MRKRVPVLEVTRKQACPNQRIFIIASFGSRCPVHPEVMVLHLRVGEPGTDQLDHARARLLASRAPSLRGDSEDATVAGTREEGTGMEAAVESFCRPPAPEETDSDRKALEGTSEGIIPFEGTMLVTYTWGGDKPLLLAHGWGSRASHMALLGRGLARKGFRVVAFDGPAHGRSRLPGDSPLTSGFAFGRAIRAVAEALGPFHAVIGHSVSAAAAVWAATGQPLVASHRIRTEELVLLSCPPGINQFIADFCAQNGGSIAKLKRGLELEFSCRVDDYDVEMLLGRIGLPILMVHDEGDEEAPVRTAIDAAKTVKGVQLVLTRAWATARSWRAGRRYGRFSPSSSMWRPRRRCPPGTLPAMPARAPVERSLSCRSSASRANP
jgi:pimeloyl-ACP methyl ester carboxylesterase